MPFCRQFDNYIGEMDFVTALTRHGKLRAETPKFYDCSLGHMSKVRERPCFVDSSSTARPFSSWKECNKERSSPLPCVLLWKITLQYICCLSKASKQHLQLLCQWSTYSYTMACWYNRAILFYRHTGQRSGVGVSPVTFHFWSVIEALALSLLPRSFVCRDVCDYSHPSAVCPGEITQQVCTKSH